MNVNQTAYVRKNDGSAGYQGEDNWRVKRISIAELQATYPGGEAALIVKREADEEGYVPEHWEVVRNEVLWYPSAYDTANIGFVEAQVQYMVDGERVGKTRVYVWRVSRSLSGTMVEPSSWEDWVNELLQAAMDVSKTIDEYYAVAKSAEELQREIDAMGETTAELQAALATIQDTISGYVTRAETAAASAEAAAVHSPIVGNNGTWLVWDQQTGDYVDTQIQAEGPQGETGPQGYSPSASVSKSGKVATITITDKTGTTTATVSDASDNTVLVQPTQPTEPENKIWMDSDTEEETTVPTMEELTALSNEINQKQDAPETAGTAGQVLGLAEVDNELVPTWMDQSGANLPTEETAQELLEYEQSNTGLTDIVLMVIGQLFDNLPQNETATDILHSLELECERLDAIYTGWIAERVNT